MPRDVVSRFAAPGGVADMDRISQVKVLEHGGSVGGVVIHVVTVAHLRRAAMAAPIVSDDAVALLQEEEHLGVPVVRAEGPSVVKDNWLGIARPPILVIDFRAVLGGDHV